MNTAESRIIISAVDRATSEIRKVREEISNVGKQSNISSKLVSGFSTEVGILSSIARKVTVAFAGVGAAMTATGVYALKSASDLEQTKIAMQTLVGSAEEAGNVLQDLSKFAAETPFEFPELAGAVKQLMAFGMGTQEAISTMKKLGDVSAGVGAPIGDLSYLIGTMRAQGGAMLIDLRQFANRGIPIFETLAQVTGKSVKEIMGTSEGMKATTEEVMKAFDLMTQEGGKFHGLMAAQSKTLSGLFSTLRDNVGMALREIVGINQRGEVRDGSVFDITRKSAQKLIHWIDENKDKITAAVQVMFDKIIQKGREWADQMGGAEGIQQKLSGMWNTLTTQVIPAIVSLVSIGASVIKFLLDWKDVIIGVVLGLETLKVISGVITMIRGLSAAIGVLTAVSTPWLIAGAVVVGLVAGIYLLIKNWDLVKAKAKALSDAVSDAFNYMAASIKSAWGSTMDWIWSKIQAITDRINKVISGYNDLPGTPNIPEIRFRAVGGSVMRGKAYIVGENGPETFIPDQSGRIETGRQSQSSQGAQYFSFDFRGATVESEERIVQMVQRALSRRNELASLGSQTL